MRTSPVLLAFLLASGSVVAFARTSTSYRLTEADQNCGGEPPTAVSTTYRVTLGTVGDAASQMGLSSTSFRMDVGFVAPYPPPLEVASQSWSGNALLTWSSEKSIGTYSVYRGDVATIATSYGGCFAWNVGGPPVADLASPPAGGTWFYLVTAKNRLREEGTLGTNSLGATRPNSTPCP